MLSIEPDSGPLTRWRNGLLLTLLAWLLINSLYAQAINPGHQFVSSAEVHPPLVALAMRHLPRLPREQADHLWFCFGIAALLAAMGLFCLAAGIPLHDAPAVGIVMIVGFHFFPTLLDIWETHLTLPVLTLICAAYYFDTTDHPYRLATCIAAAALLKTWVLALMLYLLIRRRPVAFVYGTGLFGGIVAAMFAEAGWRDRDAIVAVLNQWRSLQFVEGFANQSILGFCRVHFSANSDMAPWIASDAIMYTAAGFGFLGLLGGLWLVCRRAPKARGDQARLVFGLTMVSLLLALPVCSRSYLVLLLPVLWTLLTSEAVPIAARGWTVIIYAVLTRSIHSIPENPTAWDSVVPSAYFIGTAALWLVLVNALRRGAARPSAVAAWSLRAAV